MKKHFYLFATIIAVLSLAGCVGNERASSKGASAPQEQAAEATDKVEPPAETRVAAAQVPVPEERENSIEDEHLNAVNELKTQLAKIDGMKTGSKEFYSFSYKYLEKENVIEHKWKQSVFPKEAADQELLSVMKQTGIKNEKTIIKGNSKLMNLMLPLKPTIRCIVYYPDDTECFRVSFPFNELYLEN